jgi:hypothetical protein
VRSPVVVVVLTSALMLLGLSAAAEPSAPTLRMASSGTLELSNSLNGAAVFTARNMRPGSSASGMVSVSNTGGADGGFSLSQANLVDTPGPLGGRLSDHVRLNVEEISNGGSTAQSLYMGVLGGLGSRALGTLGAGQTRSYRFTVDFPEGGAGDNLFQSASVKVDYVWAATGAGGGGAGGGTGGGTGGGGTGGGGGGAGEPTLTLTLSGKRTQRPLRKRRLVVRASCNVACRLAPSAKVRKARGLRRLRATPATAAGGKGKRVTFKLSRKQVRALRRAFRKRKRLVALVKVTATAPGAEVTAKRRIVLRR